MKPILILTLLAAVTLRAEPAYPAAPSAAELAAAVNAQEKKLSAPTSPNAPQVVLRDMPEVEPAPTTTEEVKEILEEKPPREIENVEPAPATDEALEILEEKPPREIEEVEPAPQEPETVVTLMEEKPLRTLPPIKPVMTPTEFELKVAMVWGEPKSFFMRDLRKRIAQAKAAGDNATYEQLVTQYTTWANQGQN